MSRTNLKVFSGNRVDVVLDNNIVGLCQSARLADNYALEDASGIGDIHVIEHVPTKAVHTVAVSNMCLFTQSLRGIGGGGYTVDGDAALTGQIFDILVNGKLAGTPSGTLRAYIGCSYDSGDIDVTAHRITMGSGQFKALNVMGTGF
jgi:hypothetical protein